MAVATEIPLRNEVEPAARKILRTNQPTILARAGHVQQAAVCQASALAPFRWGNRLAFRDRGHCCFLRCKDLLPDKCDLSRVFRDFGGKMLCNHLRKTVVIFCHALPLTMKNMRQNMAGGGLLAKGNSRQHEIRGQRRQPGRFLSNHFFLVRIYYRQNVIYQGFCQNWPVEFCANLAPIRRKFLADLSIDDE